MTAADKFKLLSDYKSEKSRDELCVELKLPVNSDYTQLFKIKRKFVIDGKGKLKRSQQSTLNLKIVFQHDYTGTE